MISNDRNTGNEFKFLIRDDTYGVRKYPENYFKSIIDIGANIGMFSAFMRMRHPEANIVAVEPCIETCRYLIQNLNMLNVHIEEKALGTISPLYLKKGRRGNHEIMGHIFSEESDYENTYRVESITLKQLNDKYKIRRPYLLKINCEGGESHLVNDPSSHPILKKADFIGMMAHYKNERNISYSQNWLTADEYDEFINKLFLDTHHIKRHTNNKHGSCVYSIYKNKEFSYGD